MQVPICSTGTTASLTVVPCMIKAHSDGLFIRTSQLTGVVLANATYLICVLSSCIESTQTQSSNERDRSHNDCLASACQHFIELNKLD